MERKDAETIAERYQAGYRRAPAVDDELVGWANEGVWPED